MRDTHFSTCSLGRKLRKISSGNIFAQVISKDEYLTYNKVGSLVRKTRRLWMFLFKKPEYVSLNILKSGEKNWNTRHFWNSSIFKRSLLNYFPLHSDVFSPDNRLFCGTFGIRMIFITYRDWCLVSTNIHV